MGLSAAAFCIFIIVLPILGMPPNVAVAGWIILIACAIDVVQSIRCMFQTEMAAIPLFVIFMATVFAGIAVGMAMGNAGEKVFWAGLKSIEHIPYIGYIIGGVLGGLQFIVLPMVQTLQAKRAEQREWKQRLNEIAEVIRRRKELDNQLKRQNTDAQFKPHE